VVVVRAFVCVCVCVRICVCVILVHVLGACVRVASVCVYVCVRVLVRAYVRVCVLYLFVSTGQTIRIVTPCGQVRGVCVGG